MTGELLLDMAGENEEWKSIISCDLDNESMSVSAARGVLEAAIISKVTDVTIGGRKGKGYGMGDKEARELLIEFYHLPELTDETAQETTPTQTEEQDDFDLFGDL